MIAYVRSLGLYKTIAGNEVSQMYPLVSSLPDMTTARNIFLSNPDRPVYVLVSTAVVSDGSFLKRIGEVPCVVDGLVDCALPIDGVGLPLSNDFLTSLYLGIPHVAIVNINSVDTGEQVLHDFADEESGIESVETFYHVSKLTAARIGTGEDLVMLVTTYLYPIIMTVNGQSVNVLEEASVEDPV